MVLLKAHMYLTAYLACCRVFVILKTDIVLWSTDLISSGWNPPDVINACKEGSESAGDK